MTVFLAIPKSLLMLDLSWPCERLRITAVLSEGDFLERGVLIAGIDCNCVGAAFCERISTGLLTVRSEVKWRIRSLLSSFAAVCTRLDEFGYIAAESH